MSKKCVDVPSNSHYFSALYIMVNEPFLQFSCVISDLIYNSLYFKIVVNIHAYRIVYVLMLLMLLFYIYLIFSKCIYLYVEFPQFFSLIIM